MTTESGDLDVTFCPSGTQGFPDLRRHAVEIEAAECLHILVASLADVIRSKEAAEEFRRQLDLAWLKRFPIEKGRRRERLVNYWTGGKEAAEQFLTRFHKHSATGKPAALCLANAQREMRETERWADPVFWAGWQVWGRG